MSKNGLGFSVGGHGGGGGGGSGGLSYTSPTLNAIPKSDGASGLTDSSLSDSGSLVTSTSNINISGATAAYQLDGVSSLYLSAGALWLNNGTKNTIIQSAAEVRLVDPVWIYSLTATDDALQIDLASGHSGDAIIVNSFGGSGGDLFRVNSAGRIGMDHTSFGTATPQVQFDDGAGDTYPSGVGLVTSSIASLQVGSGGNNYALHVAANSVAHRLSGAGGYAWRTRLSGSDVFVDHPVNGHIVFYNAGTTTHSGSIDAGIKRGGANTMKITDGSTGDGKLLVGGLTHLGKTATTADPTTTEYPNDEDWGVHENTTSGNIFLAYNDGGTIRKVQLT